METRQPAVAGTFYPADRQRLQTDLKQLLDHATASDISPETIKALVVPHAGYVYSGPVAATAYHLLQTRHDQIRRVVLLGPSHRVPLNGMAIPTVDCFRTPLGDIALDGAALKSVGNLAEVAQRDDAHELEHSLEVHLPFLQAVLDNFTLTPIVVGNASPDSVVRVLETLWGGDDTLLVISSDLSHFLPYEQARRQDAETTRLIEAKQGRIVGDQACGCYPLNGLLQLAAGRGLTVRTLDVRTSGDTAGSRDQVVGYGSYAVCQ